MQTIALILAGGSGTRLWPLSRKLVPKQILNLAGGRSLLQETSRRIQPLIDIENQWIVTNNDLYHQVKSQIHEQNHLNMENRQYVKILREPEAKNTAPAVLWAALRCNKLYGSDSVMIVLASDHLILKEDAFIEALNKGIVKSSEGNIVTFGIVPTFPETGFGYIRTSEKLSQDREVYSVDRFIEKPDEVTATRFIEEGKYLWNSGMFVFRVGTMLEEASKYCPELYNIFSQIDPYSEEAVKQAFKEAKAISIDYAVMEHTKKASVVKADIGWSDVGNWKSLYEASKRDKNGNVIEGEHITIDTTDSYIYGKDRLIVSLGLSNMTIVDTPDALLVVPLDQSHRIREVVEKLQAQKSKTYIEHATVERPWGQYRVLEKGPGFKIKKITVLPKEKLSRQYHHHRSEHWIVLRWTASVTNGEAEYLVHENESTYIPVDTVHRLENPGAVPLEIIETQCGTYLEEDDIVRLEEVYEE